MSENNTKTTIDSLGEVELRYVSLNDIIIFTKLIENNLSDKDFATQVLFNQLVKPKINIGQFQTITEKEIERLAKAFIKSDEYAFKYYQNTGNFLNDFKQALIIGNKKQIEEISKALVPIIRPIQDTLNSFKNNYASLIQQTVDGASYIRESLQSLANIAKGAADIQNHIAESISPVIEQYRSMARIIVESLRPQIDVWQKWAERNKSVFDSFSNYWVEFQRKYKIGEQQVIKILKKYKWFITPSIPISFIYKIVRLDSKPGRRYKAINRLFIQYFEAKKWHNLQLMVNDWKNKPLIKKRHKILKDCVELIKIANKKGINEANVVLPTLITQVDGILTDYLNLKGIKWECLYDDWVDNNTGIVKKVGRKSLFKNTKSRVLTTQLDDLANDIFLNILFQKSQKGKPLATPFNFNRHKIIHGESVKYGRKDYLIRAFMIIDFLAYIK